MQIVYVEEAFCLFVCLCFWSLGKLVCFVVVVGVFLLFVVVVVVFCGALELLGFCLLFVDFWFVFCLVFSVFFVVVVCILLFVFPLQTPNLVWVVL